MSGTRFLFTLALTWERFWEFCLSFKSLEPRLELETGRVVENQQCEACPVEGAIGCHVSLDRILPAVRSGALLLFFVSFSLDETDHCLLGRHLSCSLTEAWTPPPRAGERGWLRRRGARWLAGQASALWAVLLCAPPRQPGDLPSVCDRAHAEASRGGDPLPAPRPGRSSLRGLSKRRSHTSL